LSVIDNIFPNLRQLGFVHGNKPRIQAASGKKAYRPFCAIIADNADCIVFFNAQLTQTASDIIHAFSKISKSDPFVLLQ